MSDDRFTARIRHFLDPGPLPASLRESWFTDERKAMQRLLADAMPLRSTEQRLQGLALELADHVRTEGREHPGLESLLQEYALDSEEGVVLMCLAEALLRIPDEETALTFLRDQLAHTAWDHHVAHSPALWVNASTWGLLLTGRFLAGSPSGHADVIEKLAHRLGEPVLLAAVHRGVEIVGRRFVAGSDITEAIENNRAETARGYCHSYDMLGEAALTKAAAREYFDAYAGAIEALSGSAPAGAVAPGISVKLSALHPRYEFACRETTVPELSGRLLELARLARERDVTLTVDAEEARRLELGLEIFAAVYRDGGWGDWEGLGLAVQAYQKRAPGVIDWLAGLANQAGRQVGVRLVKGAYWDSEIKYAQQHVHAGYPVYTRKACTDVSWLACARRLLDTGNAFYPQFATHNAHSVAAVITLAESGATPAFEFQRLHGMGSALYDRVIEEYPHVPCRVYAPVGEYRDLLPYLVRRLLENGANTSFVRHAGDIDLSLEELVAEPAVELANLESIPNPAIPPPRRLHADTRPDAPGVNLDGHDELADALEHVARFSGRYWEARPLVGGEDTGTGDGEERTSPADLGHRIGICNPADAGDCGKALEIASAGFPAWNRVPAGTRAGILERAAGLYWEHRHELAALLVFEAGRTLRNAFGEIREAMDFCYHYAALCRREFSRPRRLRGPAGESNQLELGGRGVFACISPWNFPLAIFTGQVSAALAAGNSVLAKPAAATPLTGMRAVQLLHEAGVPADVLQFLPAPSPLFARHVIGDPRLAGVAVTGSTATAWSINRALAGRDAPIVPLIAETGGQNAMIVDSSALPEQVVSDVMASAFDSAGQRCSALRVLFLQEEIAEPVCTMLAGAMQELVVDHPLVPGTDVGPMISREAREAVAQHAACLSEAGRQIAAAPVPDAACPPGHYLVPSCHEIPGMDLLSGEVFGPVLHVVRYRADHLDRVIASINATGYGLTLGIQSRIRSRWDEVRQRVRAGNVYVNRNMIGANVGVQPFGGQGLSGTGPKAGGPDYLRRFAVESTLTVNTAAIGGNPDLLGRG